MIDLKTTQRFRLSDSYIVSHVGEETLLVPISASTADMGRLRSLNNTGAAIMDCAVKGMGVGEIVDFIAAQYNAADRVAVGRDVTRFLVQMVESGALAMSEQQ